MYLKGVGSLTYTPVAFLRAKCAAERLPSTAGVKMLITTELNTLPHPHFVISMQT